MSGANALRGEARFIVAGEPVRLRPSFTALVAAEEELGSLFALVERMAAGEVRLAEIAALFWHCVAAADDKRPPREIIGEAVVTAGLASIAPVLKTLIAAILHGR